MHDPSLSHFVAISRISATVRAPVVYSGLVTRRWRANQSHDWGRAGAIGSWARFPASENDYPVFDRI